MSWDLDRLAQLAGLQESYGSTPLNESYHDDDDDDEDPDVKAAMDEAKKRKIKLPKADVDAEKDLTKISGAKKSAEQEKKDEAKEKAEAAERAKQKAAEEKEAPKTAESDEDDDEHEEKESAAHEKAEHEGKSPSKAEEKKETPAEEKKEEAAAKKARGKAPNADSKRQRLHAHMKANPDESRKNLLAWAEKNLGMGAAYAGQQIQVVRAAIKAAATNECYVLRHPTVPSFILHENGAMGMYQWISSDDENRDPLILMSESAAKKVADYLLNFKNQLVDIEHIKF